MTRDYLTVKVWDLNMESKPLETYQVKVLFCLPPHIVMLSIFKYLKEFFQGDAKMCAL